MAPLTWRNVDAPSFSGANDMWRVAASLMNSGFDRARQGLNDFRDITTAEQSSRLMQDVIAAGNDPAAIAAATAGANGAYLSPEALRFANAQPGVLLDREGKALQNTGEGLNNTIRGQTIQRNDFDFGRKQIEAQRADQDYALLPEALSTMQRIRTNLASSDPATVAAAQTQQGDFLAKYGRSLGMRDAKDVGAFMTGNLDFSNASMENNVSRLKYAAGLDETLRTQDAKGIAANTLGMVGNDPDRAITAIQGFENVDPETRVAAINQIETLRKGLPARTAADAALDNSTLFPGAERYRPALPNNYQPIIMNNRGKRNLPLNSNLNQALSSVLPDLGLTAVVTSGGQVTAEEAARGKGQRTGSVRHDHGGAADVQFRDTEGNILSWERPADVPRLQAAVVGLKQAGLTGFGAAGDYMGATTTHVGYGKPAVWGAKGGKPYQALMDAYNGAQTVANSGSGPTVDRAAAQAAAPQYQEAMDAINNNQTYNAPINPDKVQIQNPDGTISTERTFTTEIGGAWFNIPSIVNGKELPEDQALAEFRRGTNPAVGVFQNKRDAEAAAEERSSNISNIIENGAEPAATATDVQNTTITNAVTPSLDQTTQAAQPADNFPKVDPRASAYAQDQQRRARTNAINSAIADLTSNVGGGVGSGVGDFVGRTWDYFMATPEEGATNQSNRERNNRAGDILAKNANYFRQNPSEIEIARRDPIAYAERLENQQRQNTSQVPTTTAQASSSGSQTQASQPADQQQFVRRALNNAETIDQMFSAVNNTGAINQANNQYQSVNDAIQKAENTKESPAQTANRLTNKGDKDGKGVGPLAAYEHRYVTQAVQRIRDELGVNSAIAGAILEEVGDYSSGDPIFGFGQGFDLNMDKARDIWRSYQDGNNANRGISTLNASDLTAYQQRQVASIQKQVTDAEAALKAAIADPNTPPDKVALYEQQLAQLPQRAKELLNNVMATGAMDSNIRNKSRQ